jgi:hypothetical protein
MCDACQKAGKGGDKKKAPLTIVPSFSEVFYRINIDTCGPLPETSSGKRYILSAICVSSRLPEAIAIEDISSPTIVEVLIDLFCRIGFPHQVQSDRGTSFTSELTTSFFNKCGISIVYSSIQHPESNPVERMHRTLKKVLRAMSVDFGNEWDKYLPAALFALRTTTHESLGFAPAELVYGKNLRTPLTLIQEKMVG